MCYLVDFNVEEEIHLLKRRRLFVDVYRDGQWSNESYCVLKGLCRGKEHINVNGQVIK